MRSRQMAQAGQDGRRWPAAGLRARLALLLALAGAAGPALALPSTFGPTIGSALLCRSQLDSAAFRLYLQKTFGPSYKHEGGAYWFRTTDAQLWGQQVSEVMVSDDNDGYLFIAAVAETSPDKLADAVRDVAGTTFRPADASTYPLRIARPGVTIAYHKDKSKIYCARRQPLPLR